MIRTLSRAFNRASLFRHSIVGAVCAALNLAIQLGSITLLGLHYLTGNILSFAILVPLSFVLHQRITFRSDRSDRSGWIRQFARYSLQWSAAMIMNLILMVGFVEYAGFSSQASVILVTAILYGFGYVVQRRWVFQPPSRKADRQAGN